MGMFEIEEQHLACHVCSIFENKRLKDIEIQQLRKEIENDEIAPERVDAVSKCVMESRLVQKQLENNAMV